MIYRFVVVILLSLSINACFKSPTDLGGEGPVTKIDPPLPVMIKPGRVLCEGRHIINNTLVNIDVARFSADSAKIDTSGSVPFIWLKGECSIQLVNVKPLQPNLLNAALQSIAFRLDSLPLSDVDRRLRASPSKESGISFLVRKSAFRKEGMKDIRDTVSQVIVADGSSSVLATARMINSFNPSSSFRHQYLIEITFHLMIDIEKDKGMGEDEIPIFGKIIVPISY